MSEDGDEPENGPDDIGPEQPATTFPDLFGQAQERLHAAAHTSGALAVGRAGGGAVEIRVSGDLEPVGVSIARDVFDQGDAALLEDLVLAALRQALAEAVALREQAVSELIPNLDIGSLVQNLFAGPGGGLSLPGELPDLGGLLGGMFGDTASEDEDPADGTEPA